MIDPNTPMAGRFVGYRALHARRRGEPVGPSAYAEPADTGVLIPLELTEAIAPEFGRAKVAVDLPGLGIDAWQWREHVSVDDCVVFTSAHPDPAERIVPFAGFLVDVDMQYDRRDEHCILTAVSRAARLARDFIVYGRWMVGKDDELHFYNGLPASFNAGGRPNRLAERQGTEALGFTKRPTVDHLGNTREGVPVFTWDGDPEAEFWTLGDIFEYLQWMYNGLETWLSNCDLLPADYGRQEAVVVGVEGQDLWTALAAVADKAGYDVAEWTANDGLGLPASRIVITRRGAGTAVVLDHQPVNADGSFPALDVAKTNLFSASIAEATSSCVTAPIVVGGRTIYEIRVELGKAWDPDRLEVPTGSRIVHPDEKGKTPRMDEEYCQRYVIGGEKFALYADCGRLWDANTDALYSGSPWSLSVPDMAAHVGEAAGSWPEMPYRPLPCLTQFGEGAPSIESYLEISWDAGSTWQNLGGHQLLADRLGVRLTAENLAGIVRPAASASDHGNPVTENLFYKLINATCHVRLRLTISVASPHRAVVVPARRDSAGSSFVTAAWVDRASAGQVRIRRPESIGAALDMAADTADGSQDLIDIAAAVQDAAEDRFVEAALPIEWMDDVRLTDVVERIGGIEYPLQVNAGNAQRSPRVVGRSMDFRPEGYSMTLQLTSQRKAPIVTRRRWLRPSAWGAGRRETVELLI